MFKKKVKKDMIEYYMKLHLKLGLMEDFKQHHLFFLVGYVPTPATIETSSRMAKPILHKHVRHHWGICHSNVEPTKQASEESTSLQGKWDMKFPPYICVFHIMFPFSYYLDCILHYLYLDIQFN
jgi:hypothetical protein